MKAWTADGKGVVEIKKPDNIIQWGDWTPQEVQDLTEMVKFGMSRRDMAIHLGRSLGSITSKMQGLHNEPR